MDTWVRPNHPLNTRVEQQFYQRNSLIFQLAKVRQELVDSEYLIALNCCPFYLGQRLWYEDHFERIRVYVCEIRFVNSAPFYEFYVRPEKPRGIALVPKRMKVKLKYLAGVENTFTEAMTAYETRLRDLVAAKLVRLKPRYCSFDTPYILSVVGTVNRSNALQEITEARTDWYSRIFELKHTK